MSDPSTIATFVSDLEFEDIPDPVIERAKVIMADVVGVAIAGSREAGGQIITSYATGRDATDGALVSTHEASIPAAALANGTLGGVLSFDDTFETMVIHPSSPVLGAVMALGEAEELTGERLITSYIAGVETAYRVGKSMHPEHYEHGFHSTGTVGGFGAAMGAGAAIGLTAEELDHAMGIAGSGSSSLRKNGGSMTFSLHGGHAAQLGVRASRLAQRGFTANQSVFHGELGYGTVMNPAGTFDAASLTPLKGGEWGIHDIGLKAYPCARVPQAAMDALRNIIDRTNVEREDVSEVVVHFDPSVAGILETPNPVDEVEARGSIEFSLAAILLRGEATLREYSIEFISSEAARSASELIDVQYDLNSGESFAKYGARVELLTTEGETYQETVEDPPGSPANPMSRERREQKFMSCAGPSLGQERASVLFSTVENIDDLDDCGAILDTGADVSE